MKQPDLTRQQAHNRGKAAPIRYGFSLVTQEPDARTRAAGLEDAWWEGYVAQCRQALGVER